MTLGKAWRRGVACRLAFAALAAEGAASGESTVRARGQNVRAGGHLLEQQKQSIAGRVTLGEGQQVAVRMSARALRVL